MSPSVIRIEDSRSSVELSSVASHHGSCGFLIHTVVISPSSRMHNWHRNTQQLALVLRTMACPQLLFKKWHLEATGKSFLIEAVRQSQDHMPAKVVEISTTFSVAGIYFLCIWDSGFYHTPFQLFFFYNIEYTWILKNYKKNAAMSWLLCGCYFRYGLIFWANDNHTLYPVCC